MSENETNKSYEHIEEILKNDKRLKTETGELRTNLLHELVNNYDTKLFELLLSDEKIKNTFFIPVKDTFVFKHRAFKDFIDYNTSNNSYSKYLGKQIGLYVDDVPLADRGEVVLNFPFKDCVLEGGQRTEDGTDTYFEYDEKTKDFEKKQSKRREIFYNEILARDEIDQLFAPKAFCNAKKYDKDGEQQFTKFDRNADGTITDNLIIKGNNLLALHSLYQQFAGKVKLIYIDPPYNTGNDGFAYNNSFNHSTWLTFMRNRLKEAFILLKNDGAIFVSINHIEIGYLSVLLDEIFGQENKLPIITLRAGTTASYRSINDCPVNVTEYVLAYSKSSNFKPNSVYRGSSYSEDYSHFIVNKKNSPDKWELQAITDIIHKKFNCENWREFKEKFGANWKKKRYEEMEIFAIENRDSVVSLNTLQKPSKRIKEEIDKSKSTRNKVFEVKREGSESIYCFNGRTLAFFSSKFREIDGEQVPSEILTNLWSDVSFLGIGPEGGVTLENGKKPEYLIKTILELITKPYDIVFDYHLGSGTTAAVCHKMQRQYIGVEQLNYGDNDSVVRLKNVINGEQGGISKAVNWQGGGEFVYLEMAQKNEQARKLINECESYDELMTVFKELCERYFLNYNFRINDFSNKTSKDDRFKALPLERQKEIFVQMLDLNQMWVNASEMNDKRFGLSEEDKKVTNDFYGE